MADLGKSMQSLAPQPLKTLYLRNQTLQGGYLP